MTRQRSLIVFLTLCLFMMPIMTTAQVDEYADSLLPPYLPNATFAQRVAATRITSDTFLEEPIAMFFTVVGFESIEKAMTVFEPLVDHYLAVAERDKPDHFRDYRLVSFGNIGDDRAAFIAESEDIALGSSAKDVHALIRIGPNIVYVWSVSLGGDTINYLANYLEGFISDASNAPVSLLPSVSDLPIGWELPFPQPENLLGQITTAPTPTPMPTPSPTPAPTPTVNPLQPTIDALDAELRTVETALDDARATIVILEEATAASTGLATESVRVSVQVDLRGVVNGDRDAIDDAEDALASAFAPYLDDPSCTVGFALISSRSSDLGQGVQLSDAMGELIQEAFPSLIPAASDDLLFESIALPGTEPVGEVQMDVFFYDACGPLGAES